MSDRATVALVGLPPGDAGTETVRLLALYVHSGRDVPSRLSQALLFAQDRWEHPSYLGRVLVSRLYEDLDGTHGGGLSLADIYETDHRATVDLDAQTVDLGVGPVPFTEYCSTYQTWPPKTVTET